MISASRCLIIAALVLTILALIPLPVYGPFAPLALAVLCLCFAALI